MPSPSTSRYRPNRPIPAGLQGGDRIIALSGREVRDIYDLMYVLRDAKPGEDSVVVFERGDEVFERPVKFGTSRRR